jgi:uncharacterized membrane protein YfcA
MPTSTRSLATAATCSLVVFPVTVVLLNLVQASDYSPRSQAMSELALGRGGGLMFVAFTLMGAGTMMLALLLHREIPQAKVAPAALFIAAVLDVTSAIFHTNRTGTPATTTSDIHQGAGIATFVLVITAMSSTIRHFRHDQRWTGYATPTLIWSIAAIVTFFLIPALGNASFGLAQRIFVATWLSWMITTTIRAQRTTTAHAPQAHEVRAQG